MKTCMKCGVDKLESEFALKSAEKGTRQAWCTVCNRAYQRQHYLDNKRTYATKASEYKTKIRQFLYDYLSTHPCVLCGETRVAALQFDHLDQSTKSFNISSAYNLTGLTKVKEEIKKCRVLCANCHAVHTADQCGWYRKLVTAR